MSSELPESWAPPWRRTAALRLAKCYGALALISLNTVVLFVLLNAAAGAFLALRHAAPKRAQAGKDVVTAAYGEERLDKVYPDFTRAERAVLLAECYQRPFVYEDYTHFTERIHAGKYVNVRPPGYRCGAEQGPWPPAPENLNVFLLGGSTTFGYGVPDYQTLPSLFQQALARHSKRQVCCYNFGVGAYFSTQERLRYEKLLQAGFVPDVVIFTDGLNEGLRRDAQHYFSDKMAKLFDQVNGVGAPAPGQKGEDAQRPSYARLVAEAAFRRLPIGRLLRSWLPSSSGGLQDHPDAAKPLAAATMVSARDESGLNVQRCQNYLFNKFMIEDVSRRYGVTPVFVWQPVPEYQYDLRYHLFSPPEAFHVLHGFYLAMKKSVREQKADGPNFLWCAEIQEHSKECNYVDSHHYTAAFTKVFAEAICAQCLERGILDKHLAAISGRVAK